MQKQITNKQFTTRNEIFFNIIAIAKLTNILINASHLHGNCIILNCKNIKLFHGIKVVIEKSKTTERRVNTFEILGKKTNIQINKISTSRIINPGSEVVA